ncbi:unnamed protein product [Dovyalis caffra]|uniref:Uncharacterized protein n=1 Tax=Dovyalis caffra TaxID=77055 RepID=A0AAV1R239_9ROSI|nr:unnamed protein product [Dovyalis caffra]
MAFGLTETREKLRNWPFTAHKKQPSFPLTRHELYHRTPRGKYQIVELSRCLKWSMNPGKPK